MTLRILNVNSTLGLRTGGGTAERTFQMTRFLAEHGVTCKILTLDIELDAKRLADLALVEVVALPCLWKRYYVPWIKWRNIRKLIVEADVIHLMGHWGVLNAIVYIVARLSKKPYVVCPAGALPLFGRSTIIKRLYNWLIGYSIIKNASAWIAVTKSEFPQFAEYGIKESEIVIIPNGINQEDFPKTSRELFIKKYGLTDAPFILFMGRLNLIKGPDILLEAFALSHSQMPNYHLVYVGPDGGMQSYLQRRARDAGVADKVHFLGYLSGEDRSAAYHAASLLVVPSRQEAMSIVALEAMVCGTPVLLTDQCGFSEVKSICDDLEVLIDAGKISENLLKLTADEKQLEKFGLSLKEFALENYSWSQVVLKLISTYKIIIKKSETL